MFLLPIFSIFLLFLCPSIARSPSKHTSDAGLTTGQMIQKHGYPFEKYYLPTPDNYILEIHRIPHGLSVNATKPRRVVFVLHGTMGTSGQYVALGPGQAMAFILSELGYDVWLGNCRGNHYSRHHAYLDPIADKREFWNYGIHEISYYDLPTMIDFILQTTGKKSLYFVGHSQACANLCILLSTRLEYNSKIRFATFMAPAVFMRHSSTSLLAVLSTYLPLIQFICDKFGIYEVPFTDVVRRFGIEYCGNPVFESICVRLVGAIFGGDGRFTDRTRLKEELSNAPSSTSIRQIFHYGQLKMSNEFLNYDFGIAGNLLHYGKISPPIYNLSLVKVKIGLYYGISDSFVDFRDVRRLAKVLPNVVINYQEPSTEFNHADFIYARNAAKFVYKKVTDDMEKF